MKCPVFFGWNGRRNFSKIFHQKISRLANDCNNITIRGKVSEQTLVELVGSCIATVYIPRDEDFGMCPVESMAAGKPVIGVAEGGLLETIIPDETGFLCTAEPAIPDIIDAVNRLTPQKALTMRDSCEARARIFDSARFIEKMRSI